MESKSIATLEAERISNYLLAIPIQDSEKNTYADAMQKLNIQFSVYEQALWNSMLKSKWKMACIDAGLAFKEPNNNARRKLFTMLAVLEASPNYTKYFLSRNFSFFYLFKVGLVGIRAVVRASIGIIIVNNIKRRCS
ncbi:hypothetical protein BH10BAC1_BH10BAC1_02680 [soil metagenome]